MLENDIFEEWLQYEAKRVLAKLKDNQLLTQDDKLIIVLKGQMNHFHHLDVELRGEIRTLREDMNTLRQDMDQRFEQVDRRFEQVDKRFEAVTDEIKQLYRAINAQTWKMIGAVGLIVLLGRLIESF
uniref:Uncharacterized protein n=1 Tax=Candidatus Kentrum sp. LPFa TaxID=2126335 RepID=A0A450XE62_9GAMM|nr:MAG: hypothetical protein BECKLPF1236A_GA0070988_100543 [Candidatus Kentron sp. LPFa]VFK27583.1 MAG: hypothetical protein BECKLPF1236C_GA0070990_100493 [Candidatus Kentron sp. LPFa]